MFVRWKEVALKERKVKLTLKGVWRSLQYLIVPQKKGKRNPQYP